MLRTEYSGPSTQPKAQYSICFVLSIQYWILMTQCSAFCNQYSVLVINHQYSVLSTQCLAFSTQYSVLNTQYSALNAQCCSALSNQFSGAQHPALNTLNFRCSVLSTQCSRSSAQYPVLRPSYSVNTQYSLRGQYPVLMTHCSTSVASTHSSRTSTQC